MAAVLHRLGVLIAASALLLLLPACGGSSGGSGGGSGAQCNPPCSAGTACVFTDQSGTATTCQTVGPRNPEDPPVVGEPCGLVTAVGQCDGNVLSFCGQDNKVNGGDCAQAGPNCPCGFDEANQGYDCICGGQPPPPTGNLDCAGLIQCITNCPQDGGTCADGCLAKGTAQGKANLDALVGCSEAKGCNFETSCLEQQCPNEASACNSTTPPPPGDCNGITFAGQCDGNVLSYCDQNGQLQGGDCAQAGPGCTCGFDDANQGYDCICPPPTGSCVGHCGNQSPDGCWCDEGCAQYGDCCPDIQAACG